MPEHEAREILHEARLSVVVAVVAAVVVVGVVGDTGNGGDLCQISIRLRDNIRIKQYHICDVSKIM